MSKRLTIEEFIKTLKSGGSGSGDVLVVNAVLDDHGDITHLDKTWQEIYDTMGRAVIYKEYSEEDYEWTAVVSAGIHFSDRRYYVGTNDTQFYTTSPDGYPGEASGT